jgi:hypothetical protein
MLALLLALVVPGSAARPAQAAAVRGGVSVPRVPAAGDVSLDVSR